jgi:hypothetical protein
MPAKSLPGTRNGASQQALNQRWQQLRTKSIKKYQAKQREQKTKKTPSKKETTPTLTKKLQPVYQRLRIDFLQHNRVCRARFEGCSHYASDVHHMVGRSGWWLIVMKYFFPVCRSCHKIATKNSKMAIESGISLPRNVNHTLDFNTHTIEVLRMFNINPPV